jgi:HEAT repeat protein
MIVKTIERLHDSLIPIMENDEVVFAESEKSILFNGSPLSQKDQERPQVAAFLELLINFGVRSITFENGMQKDDLAGFLTILAGGPDRAREAGGLAQVMKQKDIGHIKIDQKVYVAADKDKQIIASLDIKDEQIVEHLSAVVPGVDMDVNKLKEMAKDVNWIQNIFQTGMEQIQQKRGLLPQEQLSASAMHIIRVFEKVIEKTDQEKVARIMAGSIVQMDAESIEMILTQKIEDMFDGYLMSSIIDSLSEESFHILVEGMNPFGSDKVTGNGKQVPQDSRKIQSYQAIMETERGKRYRKEQERRELLAQEQLDQNIKMAREAAQRIIVKGDETMIRDPQAELVADVVKTLASHKEQEMAQALINRLCEAIRSRNPDLREKTSTTLAEVLDRLSPADRMETLGRIAAKMVDWLQNEYQAVPAYKRICIHFKEFTLYLLRQGQIEEAVPILNVFHSIATGILEKNDKIHDVAMDFIESVASKENIDKLLNEFSNKKGGKQNDAGQALTKLGDKPLAKLLELLREEKNSDERIRIMHVIIKTGPAAVPILRDSVEPGDPWFLVRNVVYMLGRISSPASVGALRGFIDHENARVREEALSSIYKVGGAERGEILLAALPQVDDLFKVKIIEMLGNLRCQESVVPLVEILKARPMFSVPASRVDMEEKICVALGKIGSQEALPVLSEISQPKGFFNVKSYPDKVKLAAGKAINSIKSK